jgi:hypothetical protein
MTSGLHGSSGQQSTKESTITRSKRNPVLFVISELAPGHDLLNPLYLWSVEIHVSTIVPEVLPIVQRWAGTDMGRCTIFDRCLGWIGDPRDRKRMGIYEEVMSETDNEDEDERDE